MSILTKALSEFDENDVKALDNALRKFADYKKQRPSVDKISRLLNLATTGLFLKT